ncbi:hypothetical protein, partial [Mesorhizobium sp.]|uniref:hypothetical protein n=1 Tax=Mesorhizobium sp. TaxID=1871066 RepID=UPI00257EE7D5
HCRRMGGYSNDARTRMQSGLNRHCYERRLREIFLLGVAAHAGEVQDGDLRLRRRWDFYHQYVASE